MKNQHGTGRTGSRAGPVPHSASSGGLGESRNPWEFKQFLISPGFPGQRSGTTRDLCGRTFPALSATRAVHKSRKCGDSGAAASPFTQIPISRGQKNSSVTRLRWAQRALNGSEAAERKKWEFWESGEGIFGFVLELPQLGGLSRESRSRFVSCGVRKSSENSWDRAWRA